ncbi:hypothetical protein OAG24_01085 [bacterium]|nr:hypothetical protein [bacterium]
MSTISKSEAIGIILAVENDPVNQEERHRVLQSYDRLVIQGMLNIQLKSDIWDLSKRFKVAPEETCNIKNKSSCDIESGDKVDLENEIKPKNTGLDLTKPTLIATPRKSRNPPMMG